MSLSQTVFIDRSNRVSAVAAFDTAAKQMRANRQSVFIFPEGTRSYTETAEMLPFKKGAFHLAIKAQVPIVPVVVANYENVLNVRTKVYVPGKVPVKVLPPISTTGLTTNDVDDLVHRTRSAMEDALATVTREWRAPVDTSKATNGPLAYTSSLPNHVNNSAVKPFMTNGVKDSHTD